MARRRARNERAEEPSRDDPRERARALLGHAGIRFDSNASDVELADTLFRHLRPKEVTWRDLAIELMLPSAELEAKAYLLRECYFLEGWRIAEEAVARMWTDAEIGMYARKNEVALVRLRRAIGSATTAHLTDPQFCLIPPAGDPNDPSFHRQRIAHEVAKLANIADDLTRRIVWRTWVDRMDLRTAAASVSMPLEAVEQTMIRLGMQAHERIGRGDEYREWLAERPADGYPEPSDDEGGDEELEEGGS